MSGEDGTRNAPTLPDDVWHEIFLLLCYPPSQSPRYSQTAPPLGLSSCRGENGQEIIDLSGPHSGCELPLVHKLSQVCGLWRVLTMLTPRLWHYHLILDCSHFDGAQIEGALENTGLRRLTAAYRRSHAEHMDVLATATRWIRRLDNLLAIRQRLCNDADIGLFPLTLTFRGTTITFVNKLVQSIIFKHFKQFVKLNVIGSSFVPDAYAPNGTYGSLQELSLRDQFGLGFNPKTSFPHIRRLTLCEVQDTLLKFLPLFPWPRLTSLSIGRFDPADLTHVLLFTKSLLFLRLLGGTFEKSDSSFSPASNKRRRASAGSPIVLLFLNHLEIHDINVTILACPLFTCSLSMDDGGDVVSGLLYTPSLRTFDVFLPMVLADGIREDAALSPLPPVAIIVEKFLVDRIGFPKDGVHGHGKAQEFEEGNHTPVPITLRIAFAPASLLDIYDYPHGSPSFTKVFAVHGVSRFVFRVLRESVAQFLGNDGGLDALLCTIDSVERRPRLDTPSAEVDGNDTRVLVEAAGVKGLFEQVAELERDGEGEIYGSRYTKFRPITKGMVSTERFIDRFVELRGPASGSPGLEGRQPEQEGVPEALLKNMLDLLAWDGGRKGSIKEGIKLDRWLYLFVSSQVAQSRPPQRDRHAWEWDSNSDRRGRELEPAWMDGATTWRGHETMSDEEARYFT